MGASASFGAFAEGSAATAAPPGTKGIAQIGPYRGYRQLLKKIITFFRSGEVPVPPRETLEIYAFTAAADESKRRDGAPVCISEVLAEARSRQNERRDD